MRIVCDFDGTISRQDTVDEVLEQLADQRWRVLERQWLANEITAATCMREQIALIDPNKARLDAALDKVALDPGFARFLAWGESLGHDISIVSDGVDYFIDRILRRHELGHVPVVANRLVRDRRLRLEQPWLRSGCAAGSGVCKCAAARAGEAAPLVFIGDGRSDFCLAAKADVLFAKDALAVHAASRGQAFHRFQTFDDITARLWPQALASVERASL
jgi:2-hydroxy-3-keto-5-methylthiopentenyl-1-phosphate phosphatase